MFTCRAAWCTGLPTNIKNELQETGGRPDSFTEHPAQSLAEAEVHELIVSGWRKHTQRGAFGFGTSLYMWEAGSGGDHELCCLTGVSAGPPLRDRPPCGEKLAPDMASVLQSPRAFCGHGEAMMGC